MLKSKLQLIGIELVEIKIKVFENLLKQKNSRFVGWHYSQNGKIFQNEN